MPSHAREDEGALLERSVVPTWLMSTEGYQPQRDQDGFITKSVLSVSSVLARLRLDDGAATPLSPTAPVKLVFGLACILLTSLSHNFVFVLVMLACVLVRACLLPQSALARVVATAGGAALLALVIMLPATLLGQPQAALTMAVKALVSTGVAMEIALSTPSAQLTGALRAFGIPNLVILTFDLALRSIVRLGEVALEVLTALSLRSVGHNQRKGASMGGVGGVVFIKASEAAQQTHDAMRCRGFEGSYDGAGTWHPRAIDALWILVLIALIALFVYLQGLV